MMKRDMVEMLSSIEISILVQVLQNSTCSHLTVNTYSITHFKKFIFSSVLLASSSGHIFSSVSCPLNLHLLRPCSPSDTSLP